MQEALDKTSQANHLTKRIPVSVWEENEKINNFQNKGHEKETKQRDQRQVIPLRRILKKGKIICTRVKHVKFLEEVDEAS